MRYWALLVIWLGGSGIALAQDEPTSTVDAVSMQQLDVPIGYTEVFQSSDHFDEIRVVSKGIIEAAALTDKTFALTGQAIGSTVVFVIGDGKTIFRARVNVIDDSPGKLVRLYGHRGVKDYLGYRCTDSACGRADKDLPNRGLPTQETVTITTRDPDGSIVSRAKTY